MFTQTEIVRVYQECACVWCRDNMSPTWVKLKLTLSLTHISGDAGTVSSVAGPGAISHTVLKLQALTRGQTIQHIQ